MFGAVDANQEQTHLRWRARESVSVDGYVLTRREKFFKRKAAWEIAHGVFGMQFDEQWGSRADERY